MGNRDKNEIVASILQSVINAKEEDGLYMVLKKRRSLSAKMLENQYDPKGLVDALIDLIFANK